MRILFVGEFTAWVVSLASAPRKGALDLATDLVVGVLPHSLIYPIHLAPSSAFGSPGSVPITIDYSSMRNKASALAEYGMPGPAANSYAP